MNGPDGQQDEEILNSTFNSANLINAAAVDNNNFGGNTNSGMNDVVGFGGMGHMGVVDPSAQYMVPMHHHPHHQFMQPQVEYPHHPDYSQMNSAAAATDSFGMMGMAGDPNSAMFNPYAMMAYPQMAGMVPMAPVSMDMHSHQMHQQPSPIIPVMPEIPKEPQPCRCGFFVDTRVFTARPPIKCHYCNTVYHFECIEAFKKFKNGVMLGDDFFQLKCSLCTGGPEIIKRMSMSWPDILHLAMFHLTHSGHPTEYTDGPSRFFQVKQDVCPTIEENWSKFWTKQRAESWQNSIASALSLGQPHRFLSGRSNQGISGWWAVSNPFVYPSTFEQKRIRTAIYDILEDGTLVRIGGERAKKPKPPPDENAPEKSNKKARVKNSTSVASTTSTTTSPNSSGQPTIKVKKIENRPKQKEEDVQDDRPVTLLYLDVPDSDEPVRISKQPTHSAPQFHIEPDQLTVWNDKGYRMCKATHGVSRGCWYFEVEVLKPKTPTGNLRIGWSQISGNLQAPCGYDKFSYSFRSSPPGIFHEAKGSVYGSEFQVGDVLGVMINLPEDGQLSDGCDQLPSPWNTSKSYDQVQYYGDRPILHGSEIRYFVNGKDLGVAFKDVYFGKYHPAISSYMGGCVRLNFGEKEFKFEPKVDIKFKPMADARLNVISNGK